MSTEANNRTLAEHIFLKESYINCFGPVLNAFQDFDEIRFAWSIKEQTEYVRISDLISAPVFIDVTGLTRAEMCKEICKYISEGESDRLVTDAEEKRKIVALFRKEQKQ